MPLQQVDNVVQAKKGSSSRKRPRLAVKTYAYQKPTPFQTASTEALPPTCSPAKPCSSNQTAHTFAHPASSEDSKENQSEHMHLLIVQSHYTSVPLQLCPSTQSSLLAEQRCSSGVTSLIVTRTPSPELAPPSSCQWDSCSCSQGSGISSAASLEAHLGDAISTQHTSTTLLPPSCKLASRRSFALGSLSVDTEVAQAPLVHHMPAAQVHAQAPARKAAPPQVAVACVNMRPDPLEQASAQAKAQHGWFARCRGCAQMTGHEYSESHACLGMQHMQNVCGIPLCAPCNRSLLDMDEEVRVQQESQLVYIHESWSRLGL